VQLYSPQPSTPTLNHSTPNPQPCTQPTGSPDVSALLQAPPQKAQVWQGQAGGDGRGRERDAESGEERALSVGQVREELRRSEERRQVSFPPISRSMHVHR